MISKIWYLKIWMKKNKQQQKWGAKNILSYYFNINLKSLQSLNIAMQKHPLVDVQQNTCVIQNKTFQKHFSLTASFRVIPLGGSEATQLSLVPNWPPLPLLTEQRNENATVAKTNKQKEESKISQAHMEERMPH